MQVRLFSREMDTRPARDMLTGFTQIEKYIFQQIRFLQKYIIKYPGKRCNRSKSVFTFFLVLLNMIESGCFVPGFMHACIQATPPRAFTHKRSQRIHTKFISGYRFLTGTHRDCIIIIPCGPSNRYVLRPSNSESISLIAKQGWQNS